ncbi:hypothetical protein [uncultured Sphingomonas sp.]|uniref:hypothetical protein n=1 Tax=uncultured Sphingomonas sp. TaxID=158754 RepID=UPI0035C9B0C4
MIDQLPRWIVRALPMVLTKATTRRQFALAGNQCAQPSRSTILLAAAGKLVGKTAHIATKGKGEPRFDESSKN